MRILVIIFSSFVAIGCVYFAALLKHAKAHDLNVLSRANLIGALPLFAIVIGIALLVVIAMMFDAKSTKNQGGGKEE
jgi:hypothetical protein